MTRWTINLVWLLLVLGTTGAQAQDDYNPANPPEPMTRYAVTVTAEPAEAGYTSGSGKYAQGATVNVSTSAKSNYEFQYWMQDGVRIDKGKSFKYTMGSEKTSFVAVYAYNPPNPQEPTMPNSYRLYLETNEEGSCTFNLTSGQKQKGGQKVTVKAQNITPGFVFQGWYEGETQVSTSASFSYTMPTKDVTLTAHLVYNPSSPGDPTGSQSSVDQTEVKAGDVNGDGEVNEVDAQLILDVSVGLKKLSDLRAPAAINVPGGNSNALEVNAQIVLDYSVASVKPW
jgi:uncharacterized repeat protein (TIGR02543 family)